MKHLNSYLVNVDLSPLKRFCMEDGRLMTYASNECFQEIGEGVRHFGFLVSGSTKYCSHTSDGRTINVGYAFDEAFIGDYSSFLRGVPADLGISILDNASIWVITTEQLHKFICADVENRKLFGNIANDLFIRMQERLLDFYTISPKERYLKLIKECPYLLNRIALKELASYIGVTPEALSRIRKRISESH